MEKLQKKLKKQGGFTLVEMLIVVAIIAILIAVSIPMVSGALDKAREATDAANVRAAKAEASITKLDNKYQVGGATIDWGKDSAPTVNVYDAEKGIIVKKDAPPSKAYGKASTHDNKVICLAIYKDVVYYKWENLPESGAALSVTFTPNITTGAAPADWFTNPAEGATDL